MAVELRRQHSVDPALGVRVLDRGRSDQFDDAYVLVRDGKACWQVVISWGENAFVPFREELVWPSVGLAVIGGGAAVHFLELETGAPRHRLEVPSWFGGLGLDEGELGLRLETLYVLSWTDVIALDTALQTRWWARNIAVDGVIFQDPKGSVVRFSAEMDPPGGWFNVELDAMTGRELSRTPNFTDDYVGIYGSGGS